MRKIVIILLISMVSSLPLQAQQYPDFGIESEQWYQGYLIIEALQTIQMIAEDFITESNLEVAQKISMEYEKKLQQQETEKRLWQTIGMAVGAIGIGFGIASLLLK